MNIKSPIAPETDDYETDILDEPTPRAPRKKAARPVPDEKGPSVKDNDRPRRRAKKQGVSFFRDPRLHLAAGIVFCMSALVSVLMCLSFIANNEVDQDVTMGRTPTEIVTAGDVVANAGNAVGAKVAHFLMVDTLGVGSLAIAVYIFILGLSFMGLMKISFWKLSFRCFFTAAAVSLIVGLFSLNAATTFPPGGYHGQWINQYIIDYAGELTAYAVTLTLAGLLVAVYLEPLKALVHGVGAVIPRRRSAAVAETDDSSETSLADSPLDVLGADTIEETIPEDTDTESEPHVEAEIEKIPDTAASLELLVTTDGTDTEAESEPDASVASAAPVATQGAGYRAGIALESAPGEPEMIIRTAGDDSDDNTATSAAPADGAHLGLDTQYDPTLSHSNYVFPPTSLMLERTSEVEINTDEQNANKQMIINSLRSYGVEIQRIEAAIGPTVTLYEIVPMEGTKISKIRSLEDDIAMTIKAEGIRIIAPMPGRGTIGIEVPNRRRQMVSMRSILESKAFKNNHMSLPMCLGKTISNDVYIEDLAKLPHLLVAGATGQGKSVGLNCIINSLIYSKHPDELKFVLVDPKMVEFSLYRPITNAFMAKIPDEDNAIITDPAKVIATLNSLCVEMDNRYELLSKACVRDIQSYNQRFRSRRLNPEDGHRFLPYIVVVVDEFADLIANVGKDISLPISRIAAKARAVGIHMILATQRPSTDIINGSIKNNFPARIAFRVLSGIDSKTILDRSGAQRLIGNGDMLTLINGAVKRVQCAFIDTEEIEAICEHISSQPGFVMPYELPMPADESGNGSAVEVGGSNNDEFVRCALFIAGQNTASITQMQRKFEIGFNKAGRYMDRMEALGIVGPANGAKPREVRMTPDEVARMLS